MTPGIRTPSRKGAGLIEFALAVFFCLMLLMAFIEFGRMMLVYNTIANAAREGARFAAVNGDAGGLRSAGTTQDVVNEVRRFSRTGPLDPNRLTVTVVYPDGANSTGRRVDVTVTYPYDPLIGYFPLGVNLSSTSRSVITF